MITLDKLVFDATNADESANVGAFLRSADGTLLTHTTIGAVEALDVNIAGSTGLGVYAEDSAHASEDLGQFILVVRNDTEGSLVSADGDYAPLQVDALGRLRVAADIDVVTGAEKAEDAAHASGDIGQYVLNVREDVLSVSTSDDGDYQSFKSDALGRVWKTEAKQSGVYGAVSVGNTATDLVATDLANRTMIVIQNVSNRNVFIGLDASVTATSGLRLSAGSSMNIPAGPGLNWHAITASGTADLRYMELV